MRLYSAVVVVGFGCDIRVSESVVFWMLFGM